MKKFKFRLEKVLQHRGEVRDERKRELLQCNLLLEQRRAQLHQLEEELSGNNLATGVILSAAEVELKGSYSDRLRQQIAAAITALEEAQTMVEQARAKYVEAATDAKALEQLRAKREAEYWENFYKEEAQNLDEMTTQRYRRS